MKSLYSFALLASLSLGANAQTAYDAIDLGIKDLSGSARYVGMGGALGALGADVSVMHSNPAGTGLYKRNDFNVGLGLMSTSNSVLNQSNTRIGLDHLGVVFSTESGGETLTHVNFGVGIRNSHSFFGNMNTNVGGLSLGDKPTFSQTFTIADYANVNFDKYGDDSSWDGVLADMGADLPDSSPGANDGHPGVIGYDGAFFGYAANNAHYSRATSGSNVLCDLNLSVNISDQLFLGASLGFSWINMNRESEYMETSVINSSYLLENFYETSGYGVDFKIGAILRPVEDSPFRIGLAYKTSTSYKLTDRNGATIYYNVNDYPHRSQAPSYSRYISDYDYEYYDPWSINVSLGYTIGRNIAIGAEFEYQNFQNAEFGTVDGDGNAFFKSVNRSVKEISKGRKTYKIGAEYKVDDQLSVRLGYNFVQSPYQSAGFKEIGWDSPFTETDWVNWKNLHRICAGLGYRFNNKCYLDFAYQYQLQKGDFYAFNDEVKVGVNNYAYFPATEISANRGNATLTFGVKF